MPVKKCLCLQGGQAVSYQLVLGLALSFRILVLSNVDIVLGDFEQFIVCNESQIEIQLAGVVRGSLQEFGQFYIISLYLQECSIMFKNKTNWFCGSSVCFYLQLTSPSSDFFLVSVVHRHTRATKMHLQWQELGCFCRVSCPAPMYSGRLLWGNSVVSPHS